VRARLVAAGVADLEAWGQTRAVLRETVGESTFEIWLAALELIAVDRDGTLVLSAPQATLGWLAQRFGRLLDRAAEDAGRRLRMADEVERAAAATLIQVIGASTEAVLGRDGVQSGGDVSTQGSAADGLVDGPGRRSGAFRADRSPGGSFRRPACGPSCTDVENRTKEVS
jgi:hypothetical protein